MKTADTLALIELLSRVAPPLIEMLTKFITALVESMAPEKQYPFMKTVSSIVSQIDTENKMLSETTRNLWALDVVRHTAVKDNIILDDAAINAMISMARMRKVV
jgi:hypothetical protein